MRHCSTKINKYYIAFIGLLLLFSANLVSQDKQNEISVINEQVWNKFYEAFSTLNYELMAEIHHKDLMRITGNNKKITGYQGYINRQKTSFRKLKDKGESRAIELRFFERFYNENTASERGIYQLTVNEGKPGEQIYYGQFHVLHKKESGVWKIYMDYDSNENQTINKVDFDAARHIKEVVDW